MAEHIAAKVGLKDQPIVKKGQESLGLGEYAEALTEFIRGCDTPLTIALQGDWGSGKTSLMNLIQEALDDETHLTVWFNTWQYSQFNMDNTLALSMMSKLSDSLATDEENGKGQALKRNLVAISRAVAIGGASLIGHADMLKEVLNEAQSGTRAQNDDTDSAIGLESIKTGLADIVASRIDSGVKKVVVFIDDLDRLVPERAVELLETMKVFLDIDHCVFVIACDYAVVSSGLKSKFGVAEGELKGKSFFDKIIQVPFKMPIRSYQVNEYIQKLLQQIGVDCVKGDSAKYSDLVEWSVGFNPRTMKRLLNSLQLLTILDSKRRDKGGDASTTTSEDVQEKRHASRVTFAILCMLERYEPIYDYLTRNANELSGALIDELCEGLKNDNKEFDELRRMIVGNRDGRGDSGETNAMLDRSELTNAASFMGAFVECLQLDDHDNLSDREIKHLQDMLSQSSLVTAGREQEFVPRDFAQKLKSDLNRRYQSFVNSKRPAYGMFYMEKGEVYLNLSKFGPAEEDWWAWLSILRSQSGDAFKFDISSDFEEVPARLGALICSRLDWEPGKRWKTEAWHSYCFFSVDATDMNAEETFHEELIRRLKELTENKGFLRDVCQEVQKDMTESRS